MTKQSLAGVVRERLEEFEHKLFIGVAQQTLVEELRESGHEVTAKNFRNELYRARKRLGKNTKIPKGQTKTSGVTATNTQEKNPQTTKHETSPSKDSGFNYPGSPKNLDNLV